MEASFLEPTTASDAASSLSSTSSSSGPSVDPLAPLPPTAVVPIVDEPTDHDAFTSESFGGGSPSRRLWRASKYVWRWVRCVFGVVFDLVSADNPSLLSLLARLMLTGASYGVAFTTVAGQLLWGMAYLMEHGWYPMAATTSVLLLAVAAATLTSYEWMWRWQQKMTSSSLCGYCGVGGSSGGGVGFSPRGGANGGRYRPAALLVVMDDDQIDLEEDLSARAWAVTFGRLFMFGAAWLGYCLLNVRLDFWVWNLYLVAAPHHHPWKLQLVASLAAAPVLLGAAALLYFACPAFYRWHGPPLAPYSVAAASGAAVPFRGEEEEEARMAWSASHGIEVGAAASAGMEPLLS